MIEEFDDQILDSNYDSDLETGYDATHDVVERMINQLRRRVVRGSSLNSLEALTHADRINLSFMVKECLHLLSQEREIDLDDMISKLKECILTKSTESSLSHLMKDR